MSTLKKLTLLTASLMLLGCFPALLSAQDDSMGGKQMTSVTGCLKQGSGAHDYYIMGQDGKMYEVMGKGLNEHVGHTVTVTGVQVKQTAAQEQKMEHSEKTEAGTSAYADMKVSSLKMVSTSCQ